MSYIDVTGKTEEEAVKKALAQLGLDRDDVSVEILERAKSGFLGLGGNPARIRVTYEGTETAPAEEKKQPAPVRETPVKKEEQPAVKVHEAAAAVVPAPEKKTEECQDDTAKRIRTFLNGLLQQMESPAQVHVCEEEKSHYQVTLEGEKLGALIGRRGETLDAIQQLTNYAVNRGAEKRARIHVDAENYRQKREQSLESLAVKVAGKVTKYRRSVTLEPMNAYERHVIHTALQEYEGVTTYSVGTEPNRRVIVSYDRDKK
ncbi:MAG: protein jag [Clostridiales bacterium]|nr:protein jag [Clostridiales bacterium]